MSHGTLTGPAYPRQVVVDPAGSTAVANTWTTARNGAAFYGQTVTGPGVQGDTISFLALLEAGTWTLDLFHVPSNARGIYTVTIDGEQVGTVDGYAVSAVATLTSLPNIYVPSSGVHTVALTMSTKNASSSSYGSQISLLGFVKTAALPVDFLANTFYVNAASGSDSSTGRLTSTPLATLNAAFAKCTGNGPYTILNSAPAATPLREQVAYSGAAQVTVKSQTDGVKWYLYGSAKHTSGWASLGGAVWSKNIGTGFSSSLYAVVISDVLDIDGQQTKLERDTTTPTAPATGYFGWDIATTTLYLHLPDGSDPNTHTVEIGKSPGKLINPTGGATIVLHDGSLWYGNLSGLQGGDGISSAGNIYGYDTDVNYCGGSAGIYSSIDGCTVYAERCKVFNTTKNDGFSAHGAGVLDCLDCESAYNGGPIVTGTPQGATAHETSTFRWRTSGTSTDPNAGSIHHNYGAGYLGAQSPNVTIAGADAAHPVSIHHNFWRQNLAGLLSYQAGISFQTVGMTGSVSYCDVHDNVSKGMYRAAGVAVTIDAYTLAHSGVANGNGAADSIS